MRVPPFTRSYAVLLGSMVVARVALGVAGASPMIASQGLALSWITLAVLAALGWGGLFLAGRTGLAERWAEPRAALWWLVPIACGLVYGLLSASHDLGEWATANGSDATRAVWGTVDVHQPFPASIPFYWYGGAFLEIFLRLIGLTALIWLLRPILDRRRPALGLSFWTANVIASLYEPWPYLAHDLHAAPAAAWPSILFNYLFERLFVANLFTGVLYRRYGIWAAVLFRASMYLVWHVGYGGFRTYWIDLLVR